MVLNVAETRCIISGDERDEDDDDHVSDEDSDDDDEDIPYNPKNLPLGWDGKVKRIFLFHWL